MAENALTDDWFNKPFSELMAEARRVGAVLGPMTNTTRWHTTINCTPYKCILDTEHDGYSIRGIDNKRNMITVFVGDPTVEVRPGKLVQLCPFHAAIIDKTEHYNTMLGECDLLGFETVILDNVPLLADETIDIITGVTTRAWKPGFRFLWAFDDRRRLTVDVTAFPLLAINTIRTLATQPRFFSKVVING